MELFSKINKRGGSNKSVEGGKNPKINKRASPLIRNVRVGSKYLGLEASLLPNPIWY